MNRANGRLALIIAATVAYAAFFAKPLYACEATGGCPSNVSNLNGVAANALPTYPETTEQAAEPVKLKKFTKPQIRAARRAQSRKALLAQRSQGSKPAKAQPAEQDDAEARTKTAKKAAPVFANANAEFVDADAAKASPDKDAGAPAQPASTEVQAATAQSPTVELVAADQFNDLDRTAWDVNQMPKLMQLTGSTSHAELRDDDSRWAQTSTIGKLFVAFGALLTIGSAIRMFMA
jgi:hypothetical protein